MNCPLDKGIRFSPNPDYNPGDYCHIPKTSCGTRVQAHGSCTQKHKVKFLRSKLECRPIVSPSPHLPRSHMIHSSRSKATFFPSEEKVLPQTTGALPGFRNDFWGHVSWCTADGV